MKTSFVPRNKWILTSAGLLLLLLAFAGCKSKPQNLGDGLLGNRNMLPSPYSQPFEPVPEPLPPAPTVVLPTGATVGSEPLSPAGTAFIPSDGPVFVPTISDSAPEPASLTPPAPPREKTDSPPELQRPVQPIPAKPPRIHVVQAGETMGSIAACVGVRWQDIAAANPEVDPKRMQIGSKLKLPSTASDAAIVAPKRKPKAASAAESSTRGGVATDTGKASVSAAPAAIPSDGIYVVVANDSVWKIARRFKIPEKDLRSWNNLNDENPKLQIGQKLYLRGSSTAGVVAGPAAPAVTDSVAAGPLEAVNNLQAEGAANHQLEVVATANEETEPVQEATITHTVQAGETLESIALFYELSVDALLKANPSIKTNEDLTKGTVLRLQYPKK